MAQRCYGCMRIKGSAVRCGFCGYLETEKNAKHQLAAGAVLHGRYGIGKVLGQGGFGITYLAWDMEQRIPVALKEYYPSSVANRSHGCTVSSFNGRAYQEGRDRFLKEAQALSQLRWLSNIVQVYGSFVENNTAYIVMEYIDGITLQEHVRRRGGRLSPEETFTILRPIIKAMSLVHESGMIHRDISPDNIMIQPNGRVIILDFGTARNLDLEVGRLTHSTQVVLKQGFTPVEQYISGKRVDQRTDEYALCMTMYFCMTGHPPPDSLRRFVDHVPFSWNGIPGLSRMQLMALKRASAVKAAVRFPDLKSFEKALFQPPELNLLRILGE